MSTRRPLETGEMPHTAALGTRLRQVRRDAGLTQSALAGAAHLSTKQVRRLEHGERRTRLSTLQRIAEALGTPVDHLVQAAGPALAPESPYADRIARRRERRHRT